MKIYRILLYLYACYFAFLIAVSRDHGDKADEERREFYADIRDTSSRVEYTALFAEKSELGAVTFDVTNVRTASFSSFGHAQTENRRRLQIAGALGSSRMCGSPGEIIRPYPRPA